jgi:hypothetical protein
MANLSKVQSDSRELNQFQDKLLAALNPVLKKPIISGTLITKQSLIAGSNTINHGLNRELQGWIIVRQRGQAQVWDTQDDNANPNSTLILNADTNVMVDLYVF